MNKGVRFHKAMHPYAPGSVAMLSAPVADRMISEGYATAYRFPDQPFAAEALSDQEAAPAVATPARPAQAYKTKRGG